MIANKDESIPLSKWNLVLSDLDKAALVIMYPRTTPHDGAPEWSVEYALSVVGVPTELQGTIIGDRSPDGIRGRFVEWNNPTSPTHSSKCIVM